MRATTLQWALLAGGVAGLGAALLLLSALPAQISLKAALANLRGDPAGPRPAETPSRAGLAGLPDRVGARAIRLLPGAALPAEDLDLLGIPPARFLGQRVTAAAGAAALAGILTGLLVAAGLRPPAVVPVGLSLAAGLAASFLPAIDVKQRAAARREEFRYGFAVFIDLVATQHHSGVGVRQAMENAARGGDSWIFQRIHQELELSRWEGSTAWDTVERLGRRIGLADLASFADTMRAAGEHGAAVYTALVAQAAGMRQTRLAAAMAEANQTSERMTAVTAILAFVLMAIVATPAVITFMSAA